ncbi:MAG: hypothetical protein JXB88_06090 [Spirochaetales bacterium]|nr:hypothetical protein [Spirochaetales bacterium]
MESGAAKDYLISSVKLLGKITLVFEILDFANSTGPFIFDLIFAPTDVTYYITQENGILGSPSPTSEPTSIPTSTSTPPGATSVSVPTDTPVPADTPTPTPVDNDPPGKPTLLNPSGSINWDFDSYYTFEWSNSTDNGSGLSHYQLLIDINSNFSSPLYDEFVLENSEAVYNDYFEYIKGMYYYKVIAYDKAGNYTESNSQSFTVNDHPPTTDPDIPGTDSGSCISDTTPYFSWWWYESEGDTIESGKVVFRLYIDDDTTPFTTPVRCIEINRSNITDYMDDKACYNLDALEALPAGGNYYWGIEASSDGGTTWKQSNSTMRLNICP